MKKGYTGFESSGKSYFLAQDSAEIMYRNERWAKKYKLKTRPIVSCIPYSDSFLAECETRGVPVIHFESLEEIKNMTGCDIFVDEIVKFFDSRFWEKLSLEIRTWVSESAKTGVHWYFGAQNFEQVDVSFRRLVQPGDLVHVTKLFGSARPHPSMPPVKRVWGVIMRRAYSFDEAKKEKSAEGFPQFSLIRKNICSIFDTNKRIEVDNTVILRHIQAKCSQPYCDFHKVMHA
jgi:hypothetical protein